VSHILEKKKWTGGPVGFANFSYAILEKPEPQLRIKYSLPIGKGRSNDSESPIIRPFKKILKEGKKPGKITFVFLNDNGQYFVLGAFSFTVKHLIFFPGFKDRRLSYVGDKQYLNEGVVLHIDHLTLDQNLRTWHFTFDEKNTKGAKIPTNKTKKIDETNFLWFACKVSNSSDLYETPNEQEVNLKASLSEIKRRVPIIHEARKGSIFQIVHVDEKLGQPFFWYFEFFVNTSPDRENYPHSPVIVVPTSQTTLLNKRREAPTRTHHMLIEGFKGSIFIRVSKFRGSMKSALEFVSGHEIRAGGVK